MQLLDLGHSLKQLNKTNPSVEQELALDNLNKQPLVRLRVAVLEFLIVVKIDHPLVLVSIPQSLIRLQLQLAISSHTKSKTIKIRKLVT